MLIIDKTNMEIDEMLRKHKLISIYSTKNLIISPPEKGIFNKYVKELTKNFSKIHIEYYTRKKLSIIQITNKKIRDSIFVNSESIKLFLSEFKDMKIPESIIKEYSITFLNNQKRLAKEERWRKVIFPKTSGTNKKNKNKSKKEIKKIKIDNNNYNNYNIADYFIKTEKIFKITKIGEEEEEEESLYQTPKESNNTLLLGKKRNLSYNDSTKEKSYNQLSSSISSINIEENALQYIPSLFTTSPSILNNKSEEYDNKDKECNDNKIKEKQNKKRCIYSTLKDVSRETLFFLIQKPDTTIEEITKYIFNLVNIKTVHGKTQTYNNIQRRVYDTINVLQGLNKIEKKGFLQIHYILSEKEKEELVIINKQKELIIKLYLLYISNLNNKEFYTNLKNILNNDNFIIDKEQYLASNDILEYTKERIMDTSKGISIQCYEYLYNKNILDIFKIHLLSYDKLFTNNILENNKNNQNNNDKNIIGIEDNLYNGNNISSVNSKNTNDSSINQKKEEIFIDKNNNEIERDENRLQYIDNSALNINNLNLMNINRFQNLQYINLNNNPFELNNLNFNNNNSLNNNNFLYINNFLSDY